MDIIEKWVGGIGIVAGLVVLVIALWRAVWRGLQHTAGRTTGIADKILRRPFLFLAALLWLILLVILWQPLPLTLSIQTRVICLSLGALLYLSGLILYLWGGYTLGEMYKPASSFGVQLNADHRLITHGAPLPMCVIRCIWGCKLLHWVDC